MRVLLFLLFIMVISTNVRAQSMTEDQKLFYCLGVDYSINIYGDSNDLFNQLLNHIKTLIKNRNLSNKNYLTYIKQGQDKVYACIIDLNKDECKAPATFDEVSQKEFGKCLHKPAPESCKSNYICKDINNIKSQSPVISHKDKWAMMQIIKGKESLAIGVDKPLLYSDSQEECQARIKQQKSLNRSIFEDSFTENLLFKYYCKKI